MRLLAIPVQALVWVLLGWIVLMLVLAACANHVGWPLLAVGVRVLTGVRDGGA